MPASSWKDVSQLAGPPTTPQRRPHTMHINVKLCLCSSHKPRAAAGPSGSGPGDEASGGTQPCDHFLTGNQWNVANGGGRDELHRYKDTHTHFLVTVIKAMIEGFENLTDTKLLILCLSNKWCNGVLRCSDSWGCCYPVTSFTQKDSCKLLHLFSRSAAAQNCDPWFVHVSVWHCLTWTPVFDSRWHQSEDDVASSVCVQTWFEGRCLPVHQERVWPQSNRSGLGSWLSALLFFTHN